MFTLLFSRGLILNKETSMARNAFIKDTAAELLKRFKGVEPSAGEVDSLSEDIAEILTNKYNVSKGNV